MKVIDPSVIVSLQSAPHFIMQTIEDAGRTCYKSEDKINETSHVAFIERLVRRGHEAMLEHGYATAHFRIDRGISHELVRHRLASFAQESTRYCNYKDKDIEFVRPSWFTNEEADKALENYSYYLANPSQNIKKYAIIKWFDICQDTGVAYKELINHCGRSPQEARSVLPNALATDIVVTANLREWRTILKLRCAKDAHPDMRYIMLRLLSDMHKLFPPVFEDIYQLYKEEVDALARDLVYVLPHTEESGTDACDMPLV